MQTVDVLGCTVDLVELDLHSVLCSHWLRAHHQRILDPQRVGFLIDPLLRFVTELKVEREEHCGQDESHLMCRHVLPQTITRAETERLMRLHNITSIP